MFCAAPSVQIAAVEAVMLQIKSGEWVVVCDGAKALLLENAGDSMFLYLKTREVFEQPDLPDREISADKPGRAFQSVGNTRSSMEQVNRHDQEEERFLASLAARLDKAVLAGDAPSIIIVAPPRAIGILRQNFTQHVRQAIKAEIEKDLIKMPVYEIERHLRP
jgi:protein required for attachment to host cells